MNKLTRWWLGNTLRRQEAFIYADVVRRVAFCLGDERASKCGYDLLMGLVDGDAMKRAQAWERAMADKKYTVTQERNGVWVPATPNVD
jgi:hypothetical protein